MKTFSTRVSLHDRPLAMHLAVPVRPATPDVLVLYASGDGGWFGAAVDMFAQLGRDGYYAAGFSSRAFLKLDRAAGELASRGELAEEYRQIIDQSRTTLGLPATIRTVLTGWSRGAAFAVLAAADPSLRPELAGLVAIGLPDEEQLRLHSDSDDDEGGTKGSGKPSRLRFETYSLLPRLDTLACAVIQARGDEYLGAVAARRLMGEDTADRRLYTIDARNHRFSGGQADFRTALADALRWVVSH